MYLTDQFKTLQLLQSWSEDMHMVLILSLDYFYTCFLGVSDFENFSVANVLLSEVQILCAKLLLEFLTVQFETL